MRQLFVAVILGSQVLGLINVILAGSDLRGFLARVPQLGSSRDLELYRAAVARQMYAALVQIVLLLIAPAGFFWGLARGVLAPGDVLLVVIPAAVVILMARVFKPLEERAQSLPAADDDLARERDRVVATWRKKPLPDW